MERDLVTVDVTDDQEKVAQEVARFDLHAIPVVDDEHHMLGIITHDDVIDVFSAEATEDVYRMGAVTPLVENYLEANFRTIWWKRSVWLSCLFVAELFTFTALGTFRRRDRANRGPGAVRAAVHFDRRQLRLAGRHADHAGHGPGPGRPSATGGACCGTNC